MIGSTQSPSVSEYLAVKAVETELALLRETSAIGFRVLSR